MSSINSYLLYFSTTLKSRHIRHGLIENGLDYTISKYPTWGGKQIHSADYINQLLTTLINGDMPFMVGRFGSVELSAVAKQVTHLSYKTQLTLDILCNNAGFFPHDSNLLSHYAEIMVEAMAQSDIQGIWYLPYEDLFVKDYLPKACFLTEGRYLEPWFSSEPWTKALEGKRVLVIHPFSDSIKSQYSRRDLIFDPTTGYLPDFDLKVVKAVQTIAGTKDERFSTWFEALDYMTEEAMKTEFDIAIIGCGAYGYPLAANIKKAGKKAIHLGGVTQVLFGIKGKRWELDKNPIIRDMFNQYWIRPNENEIPRDNKRVEDGCYW